MEFYYDVNGDHFPPLQPRPVPPVTGTQTGHIPLPTVTHAPPSFEHIHTLGHRTQWVLFVIMLISSLCFIGAAWRVNVSRRLFYQLSTIVTVIGTVSYYAQATGSGWSWHHVWVTHDHKHGIPDTYDSIIRQTYWIRYVDWLISTPLILFNLSALAGLSGSAILNVIAANVFQIVTVFFAAFGRSQKSKWGWYAMSWLGFAAILWNLGTSGTASARKRGVQNVFLPLTLYTATVWTGYLVVWGVSDLSRVLSPNQEVVAFAVLDLLAKPVFGLWLIMSHQRDQGSHVQLDGAWTDGFGHGHREGLLRVGDHDDA